jgi:hypothetical protein
MSQTLTTITGDMSAVLDLVDQAQGELNPVLESWLAEIGTSLAEKVDAYVGRITALSLLADQCRARAQDAQKASRTLEGMQDALEDRIKHTMRVLGRTDLTGEEWRYKLSPTKGSLVVNEAEIPTNYTMQVTTTSVDKERVRASLDAGELVPGAEIKPGWQLRKYRAK